MSALGIVTGIPLCVWCLKLQVERRLLFRHSLILMLIITDVFKAITILIYPSYIIYNPVAQGLGRSVRGERLPGPVFE